MISVSAKMLKCIANAYTVLKEFPYTLHCIVIHEGEDNSGHYYSYIKNHIEGYWYKYDDHRVTEVAEEKVLSEAYGTTKLKTSAYLVMYVAKSAIEDSTKQKSEFDYYLSLIPKNLINEVNQNNIRFNEQLQEVKTKEVANEIMEHFKFLDNTLKKKVAGVSDKSLISFPIFCFIKQELIISQHVILDSAIQEKHPAKLSIDCIDQDLEATLLKAFNRDVIYLSDQRKKNLENLKIAYYFNIEISLLIHHALEMLMAEKYMKAFETSSYIFTMTSNSNYVDIILLKRKQLLRKHLEIYAINLISRSNHDLVNNNIQDWVSKVSLVTMMAMNYIPMSSGYLYDNLVTLLKHILNLTSGDLGKDAKGYSRVVSGMEKRTITHNHSITPKISKDLKKRVEEAKKIELLK